MNYRRKPIQVQALQWTGDNYDLLQQFVSGDKALIQEVSGDLKLLSLNGYMTAHKGDYIIRTLHGEVYPCSQYSFKEIYEES